MVDIQWSSVNAYDDASVTVIITGRFLIIKVGTTEITHITSNGYVWYFISSEMQEILLTFI